VAGDECAECPSGWFQDQNLEPSLVCKKCPQGYGSVKDDAGNDIGGSALCRDLKYVSECTSEQYLNDTSSDPANYSCETCPLGAACGGNTASWSNLGPLFGFWRIPNEDLAGNPSWKSTAVFAECYYPPACLGAPNRAFEGRFYSDDGKIDLAMVPESKMDTMSNCSRAKGFRNNSRLCQACRDGFSRTSNSQCKNCELGGMGSAMIFFVTGVALVFIGFSVLIGMKLKSFSQSEFVADRRKKSTHSTLKRIFLSHVQTVSLVMGLAVPWPGIMLDALSILSSVSTFSENANGVECLIAGEKNHAWVYYMLLTCMALAPIAFIILLALFWFGVVPSVAYLNSKQDGSLNCFGKAITCGTRMQHGPLRLPAKPNTITGRFIPSYADAFTASSVLCWFLMLPSLMRVGFGVFQCRSVGNPDVDFLVISMEEHCWKDYHLSFAVFVGAPMLMIYAVMFPSLILLRLHRAKLVRSASPNLLLRFGLLYSGYRPKKFWWELIVLMRKYCIIAASTIIVSDKNQLQIVLGVFIIALHMHDSNEPFGRSLATHRLLHRFEMLSLLLLTFLVWSGLYFSSFSHLCGTTQSFACTMCVVLILLLNVGYMVLLTGNCFSQFCKRNSHVKKKLTLKLGRIRKSLGRNSKKVDKDIVGLELTTSPDNPLYRGNSGGKSGGKSSGSELGRSFGEILRGKSRILKSGISARNVHSLESEDSKSNLHSAISEFGMAGTGAAVNPMYNDIKPESAKSAVAGAYSAKQGKSTPLAAISRKSNSAAKTLGKHNPLVGMPGIGADWMRHYDAASASWYLYNGKTGESKWEDAGGGTDPSLANTLASGNPKKKKRYSQFKTGEGKSYFVSESGDRAAVWELPDDGILVEEVGEDAKAVVQGQGGSTTRLSDAIKSPKLENKRKKKRFSEFKTIEGQSYFVSESGDGETLWDLPEDAMLL
jgi:hypothetical protein